MIKQVELFYSTNFPELSFKLRGSHLEVYKKYFLKITPNSSENTCAVAFFNEATDPRTVSLSKRDSGTGVFQ